MTITKQNKNRIEECRKEIEKLLKEIEYYTKEILRCEGKVHECEHCKGEGRFKTGHSFNRGPIYTKCIVCNGIGKVTKERLEEYRKEGA